MNQIKQTVNQLNQIDMLLDTMKSEIDLLRSIVARYRDMYGEEIKCNLLILPPSTSFSMVGEGGKLYCKTIDHEELGITSNYQRIRQSLSDLGK